MKQAIAAAVRTVEPEAQIRNVSLILGDFEDVEIRGYRLRLEQVIVNLLDNAIKFNRTGGEARIEVSRIPDRLVKIVVSDTGSGIASQNLSRIFERFYRVDRARSRQVGGTGLGLAIVKHAVELMNGRIEVNSDLGKGSTFTVVIPVEIPATFAAPSPRCIQALTVL